MYSTILALHILSAVLAGGVCVAALLSVHYQKFSWATLHARAALYTLSAWLVFSGALLAVLSPNVSAISVCDNLALYVLILAVPLVVLHRAGVSHTRCDSMSRHSLAGAALLFIGILAVGL